MQIDFDMPDDAYLKGQALTTGLKNLAKLFGDSTQLGALWVNADRWRSPFVNMHTSVVIEDDNDGLALAREIRSVMLAAGLHPKVTRWGAGRSGGDVKYVLAQYRSHRSLDPEPIVTLEVSGSADGLAKVWPEMPTEADAPAPE